MADISNRYILTNIQDLRTNLYTYTKSFPQNLTVAHINVDMLDSNMWNNLPHTLTELEAYCGNNVCMKNLPLSLKKLTCVVEGYMKEDDYFNSGLEELDTDVWHYSESCFNARMLPNSLTSLTANIRSIDSAVFSKSLPRTLLHLNINTTDVDEEFYQNLPPKLLSLVIDGSYDLYIYPSLLPRTLTVLQSEHDRCYLIVEKDVDFPPNIRHIWGIFMTYKDCVDLSNLIHLHTLVIKSKTTAKLPPNLKYLDVCTRYIDLPKYITTYSCDVMLLSEIKNLPRSLLQLCTCTLLIDTDTDPVFPPNLKSFMYERVVDGQISYEQLLCLPNTLRTFIGNDDYKLVRTIDGNKWEKDE